MALSKREIDRYASSIRQISERAAADASSALANSLFDSTPTRARLAAAVSQAARKHMDTAREAGAQWYEYASEAAGIDVDPAFMDEYDYEAFDADVLGLAGDYLDGSMTYDDFDRKIQELISSEVRNAARQEVIGNLDRDARGNGKAGYARVPVGETCAWCFMLASLGYYYRSYESAGGLDPDHYHKGCDCVVVPYSEPGSISGYSDYERYVDMYERANEARKSGDYSDEMRERIERARERHEREYAAGRVTQKWSVYNETLMLMREQNGLRH